MKEAGVGSADGTDEIGKRRFKIGRVARSNNFRAPLLNQRSPAILGKMRIVVLHLHRRHYLRDDRLAFSLAQIVRQFSPPEIVPCVSPTRRNPAQYCGAAFDPYIFSSSRSAIVKASALSCPSLRFP